MAIPVLAAVDRMRDRDEEGRHAFGRAGSAKLGPDATACQRRQSLPPCQTGGCPGERILLRVDLPGRRLWAFIATSWIRLLRRPVESAL